MGNKKSTIAFILDILVRILDFISSRMKEKSSKPEPKKEYSKDEGENVDTKEKLKDYLKERVDQNKG